VTAVLVHGLAITGASVVRALQRRGYEVAVSDDRPDDHTHDLANALGVELLPAPSANGADPRAFACQFDLISPAPGVPETHPLLVAALAAGVPLVSEIELAYRWEQADAAAAGRPTRPMLAITGTDGKTTTTEMTVAILRAGGVRTEALGNTDVPLVDAIDATDDAGQLALDAFVVECTSFRLAWTEQFRAEAAAWLNLAPDHLNWHVSMDTYEAAKARIWGMQRAGDAAIGFAGDPAVMRRLAAAPGRRITFGRAAADYRVGNGAEAGWLCGPAGTIAEIASMRRSLPHDVTNALAASALVIESGLAGPDAIAEALGRFSAPPHRLEPCGAGDGVSWFNDSKATTPHAASTAIRAFESLVLIAGGSRKGVDLSPMGVECRRVRAVVAIGEAASDIHGVFDRCTTVVDASTMADAVRLAGELARPGDAVVLSPGCASFDWYSGYPARGDDFKRLVAERLGGLGDRPSSSDLGEVLQ
jgi:UDP-N-acetylmuramoylalanine--D-glutamate ligase